MRGKPAPIAALIAASGLIPACAGKTDGFTRTQTKIEAHPRVCGENIVFPDQKPPPHGSSPRVRGKPVVNLIAGLCQGLIPACAGKTLTRRLKSTGTWAHPRVCGENFSRGVEQVPAAGSSPRVRGKLSFRALSERSGGLIPACAGKTFDSTARALCAEAHPRVCGENFPSAWISL